jgi:Leucine-rich repeat (LRR) protein
MSGRDLTDIPPLVYLKSSVLKALTLMRNNLQTLNEAEFGKITNLTHLNLAFNNLTAIPDTIGLLIHLKDVDVSHNKLKEIPISVCLLVHLNSLNVAKNHITELPVSVALLNNLTHFDASKNRLKGISREIVQGN